MGVTLFLIMVQPSVSDTFLNLDLAYYNPLNSTCNQQIISFNTTEFPSYKEKKHLISLGFTNSEIDFPTNEKFTVEEQKKRSNENINNADVQAVYGYNQTKERDNYSSGVQSVLNLKNTFQTKNVINSADNGFQSVRIIEAKNQSISNTTSNSFIANNTLSISTDLSGNNLPMMVDGGGNPGDPAVPVGDGVWIMLLMLLVYCAYKI